MKIAFLGLGHMGSILANRIFQYNKNLIVFNRTASKMEPFAKKGIKTASSIQQAVESADVILTSLFNDEAVLQVSKKLVQFMPKKSIHVGLSTISPKTAEEAAKIHEDQGHKYLSGVVLGNPKMAQKGALTTFCSGKEDYFKVAENALQIFSQKVVYLGAEIKAANIMKICLNYSLITFLELFSELYVFAEKSGLDGKYLQESLHNLFAHPGVKVYIDKIYNREFEDINFELIGGDKDVALFQQVFDSVGVTPDIGNVVRSRYKEALSKGMAKKDWSAIYEVIRDRAGLEAHF